MRKNIIDKLEFDWEGLQTELEDLSLSNFRGKNNQGFVKVTLPDFVGSYGLKENKIFFPKQFITPHKFVEHVVDYKKCNWLGAVEYLVSLDHENQSFFKNILSTSSDNFPKDIYKYALVNRYLLFLRDLAAYENKKTHLIGKTPKPKILLTHDVDAIDISFGLKIRQYFQNKNWPNLNKSENLKFFKEIVEMEEKYNTKSIFFFSAYRPFISLPLIDPKYKLDNLVSVFQFLESKHFEIGLHPSVVSSFSKYSLNLEIKKINKFISTNLVSVRNHWLSFFKNRTWRIQQNCNIKYDFTLGFNDIPGFRNFCALHTFSYRDLKSIPTFIMDGQFYNYNFNQNSEVIELIKPYIDEVKNVGGVASIDFHQRFFHEFYGYKNLYEDILKYLEKEGLL